MSAQLGNVKEFTDADYTQFRKKLLREKGGDRQREFLEAVRDTSRFLDYVSELLTVGSTGTELAQLQMTESEYKDPPSDTEHDLYVSWSALAPSIACRSTFWACLTIEHIKGGYLQPVYLAANGGNLSGGAERIDLALNDTTSQALQRIDSCVRTVLRRLGGLPEIRGNRSVYVDCPFARAWWRERMVEQAARGDAEVAAQVRDVIRISQTYWEKLVDRIVFRNSTFGSVNIRSAFLRALAQAVDKDPDSGLKSSTELQRICRRATAYQGNRELSILDDDELDDLMQTVVSATSQSSASS